ncbi:MAG: LamG domain-containing protein [Planctomycetes bacterium]|nr:LamG domain-containing protein [Planctomycetota bacterium]
MELLFWNGLPGEARPVTGYIFSRGEEGAGGAPGDHLGIGGTQGPAGKLFFYKGGQLNQTLSGKTEIPLKTWHHVALAREGKKVTVYLNGSMEPEIAGEAEAGFPAGAGQIFIGGCSDNFASFEGRIDKAATYNRALQPEEIAARFQK